jgi:predicted RNA-binding protein (virulence factor B family)
MVRIGKASTLEVVKFTDQGAYLDGGPYGEILLPNRYVPENCKEEDEIEVFISFDSEDRILATTDFPFASVGE